MHCGRMSVILLAVVLVVGLVEAESPASKLFGSVSYRLGCLSPDKTPGFCVPYPSCPAIKDFIPKHDPKFILQALSDYTCGFDKGNIFVCCPRSSEKSTTTQEVLTMEGSETFYATTISSISLKSRIGPSQSKKVKIQKTCIEDIEYYSKCICPERENSVVQHKNLHLLPKECGIMATRAMQLQDHPWTVLLRLRQSHQTKFTCVGVLISTRYVLTAAHCVKNALFPQDAIVDQVRVGEYDPSTEPDCVRGRCSPQPKDVDVEENIIHPDYNIKRISQDDDIALIRLKTPVEINAYVRPICLPDDTHLYSNSDTFWSVGWGSGFSKKKNESYKSKTKLITVPTEECALIYENLGANITDNKICAGVENDDESCQSGSPLMTQNLDGSQIRWYLQGIFSLTPTACGTPAKPSIFINVSKYRNWILDNIKE